MLTDSELEMGSVASVDVAIEISRSMVVGPPLLDRCDSTPGAGQPLRIANKIRKNRQRGHKNRRLRTHSMLDLRKLR